MQDEAKFRVHELGNRAESVYHTVLHDKRRRCHRSCILGVCPRFSMGRCMGSTMRKQQTAAAHGLWMYKSCANNIVLVYRRRIMRRMFLATVDDRIHPS